MKQTVFYLLCSTLIYEAGIAGPYSSAMNDPTNSYDAPVPGFVGPHGDGKARLLQADDTYLNPENYVNPLFFGWADGVSNYTPAPGVAGMWQDSELALGPVTGDNFDVVSLGDLNSSQISNGVVPGQITLTFSHPIQNKTGADLVVFENAFISQGGAGVAGEIAAELAYVEVSSDGVNFARFPSRSLTPSAVGPFGTINPTNVFGLAGKHVNAYGESWGTPFDLSWLADHPLVTGGVVNLNAITHVRIVDIPGSGYFRDSNDEPIFDAWVTSGSGGHDLEAVGVISKEMNFDTWLDQRGLTGSARDELADLDNDGIPNLIEYAAALLPTAPDAYKTLQELSYENGRLSLSFRRDERTSDLKIEVEASNDLQNWEVIARSVAGGVMQPVPPNNPSISETSASSIASVGVIRWTKVEDVVTQPSRRFLRLRVSRIE